jgi:hypothetical protein
MLIVTNHNTERGEATINYIQQEPMFSLQEILDLESKTKYHYIFKELNVYPAVKILTNNFNKGTDGYNKANSVRALIAMQIEDIQFRISCGFKTST